MGDGEAPAGVRADELLGGRLSLLQPAVGYRAGLDALLLAASLEARPGDRLIEFGCGAGAALLAAATRLPHARFLGVERDPAMAALARENAARNACADRVEVREADVFAMAALDPADGVFLNPPYSAPGRSPAPARRGAFVSERPVGDWIKAAVDRLTGGAALTLIHRADRLPEILAAFEGRLGGIEALPLRPRAGAPAIRVLARARKGSRAPFRLHAGLDLHADDGRFTPRVEAILRDGAALAWNAESEGERR